MIFLEDSLHWDGRIGPFEKFDEAVAELTRLSKIPWDQEPNRAPCFDWQECGRTYEMIITSQGGDVFRTEVLRIFAGGTTWSHRIPELLSTLERHSGVLSNLRCPLIGSSGR